MKVEYRTVLVTLLATEKIAQVDSSVLPAGKVRAIGAVQQGNDSGDIINISILDNNQTVLHPCDIRFNEPKAAGNFIEGLRPVDFSGGKSYTVQADAVNAKRANKVTVQVLFAVLCQ